MKKVMLKTSIVILLLTFLVTAPTYSQTGKIEKEILHHGEVIRKAFSDGYTEKIESLHYPNVVKALAYVRYDKSPTGWATIREIIQPLTE